MYILNIVKITLKAIIVFLLSMAVVMLSSCSNPSPRFERYLGTVCFVNLYEKGRPDYYDEIFDRLKQIDEEFSFGSVKSDVYRINAFAARESVHVSDDVFFVLETAKKISELTGGAFDVTIEPLVNLWRINSTTPHIATQDEIDALLPFVGYESVILDPALKTVRFAKDGVKIDFGGIAKGFAADEIAKICKKHKIKRAVIDLGGNVYVFGVKKRGELWNVGVKNPEYPDSAPLIKVSVPQLSVVTSGIYERFFEKNDKRYHHILSPDSGYPVENDLYSSSVLCSNSMVADALSTAFFVLGREKSLEILPAVEEELGVDIAAVFIAKNHSVYFSENFSYSKNILYSDWRIHREHE